MHQMGSISHCMDQSGVDDWMPFDGFEVTVHATPHHQTRTFCGWLMSIATKQMLPKTHTLWVQSHCLGHI